MDSPPTRSETRMSSAEQAADHRLTMSDMGWTARSQSNTTAWPTAGTTTVPSSRRRQAPPRQPAGRGRSRRPAQAHLGREREQGPLAAAAAAPPPRGGRASTVAARERSSLGPRSPTPPGHHRATRRHRQRGPQPPREGDSPPPPSPSGLCPARPLAAAGGERRGREGPEAGGAVAPPCRLGLATRGWVPSLVSPPTCLV